MSQPNIVYLHSHDTGRYVQPYGYAVPTPNIQKLAEEGMLFRRAFSAAPTCSPSRAALLTGQCPHASGLIDLAHRGFRLNDPSQHLATVLRDGGYRTALLGFQHVTSGNPSELGYTDLMEPNEDGAAALVPKVGRFLDNHLANRPDEPFFLDVGAFETHRDFLKFRATRDSMSDPRRRFQMGRSRGTTWPGTSKARVGSTMDMVESLT
jgi:arylsulfatase A-like enzyme